MGFIFWPLEIFALPRILDNKAVRLRKLLTYLGPTFIKFGQILSTRNDIIGTQIANELSLLQDKLPAFSYKKVKQIITLETGKK